MAHRRSLDSRIRDHLFRLTKAVSTVGDLAVVADLAVEDALRVLTRMEDRGEIVVLENAHTPREQWIVLGDEQSVKGWQAVTKVAETAMAIRPEQSAMPQPHTKDKGQRVLDYLFAQPDATDRVGALSLLIDESIWKTIHLVRDLEDRGLVVLHEETDAAREHWKVTNVEESRAMNVRDTARAQQDAADGEIHSDEFSPLAAHGDSAELVRAAIRLLSDLAAPTMPARKRAVERLLTEALAILDRDA